MPTKWRVEWFRLQIPYTVHRSGGKNRKKRAKTMYRYVWCTEKVPADMTE